MGRLFWKIFTWFWVALLLIGLGVGASVRFYLEYSHYEIKQQLPRAQIAAITLAIERANIEKVKEILSTIGKSSSHPIFVLDGKQQELLGRQIPPEFKPRSRLAKPPPGLIRRKLFARDGKRYTLITIMPKKQRWKQGPGWHLPYSSTIAIIIALLISTLVCFWLTRYLTRPMKTLSEASNQLAAGNLNTRIGNLGRRKDEIADMARDFDAMAERLQSLINGHSQLMSDISHELRSPLTRLQVALALARRDDNGQDTSRLDSLERDTQRLEELINQVLTLSRLETTTLTVKKTAFDLSALIENLVSDIQLEAEQKSCTLALRIDQPVNISGDAELIRRAIENVIRNAVYYTDNNTEVSIVCRTAEDATTIEISDLGPGIAEDRLEDVFKPFVRTDQARERNTGGFGLGLAIAKRAIEAHGGTIVAKNRPGSGLTITMRISSKT